MTAPVATRKGLVFRLWRRPERHGHVAVVRDVPSRGATLPTDSRISLVTPTIR